MRSRLHPYRADIEEALAAGISERALARTYGVANSTMREFIGKGRGDRHNPLQRSQYDTLRLAKQSLTRAVERAREDL